MWGVWGGVENLPKQFGRFWQEVLNGVATGIWAEQFLLVLDGPLYFRMLKSSLSPHLQAL